MPQHNRGRRRHDGPVLPINVGVNRPGPACGVWSKTARNRMIACFNGFAVAA
jgi:hypothetical protein